MVTQLDSPDGKTHKDPDRPSPDLVETDTASKEGLPGYGSHQPPPSGDKSPATSSPGQSDPTRLAR